MTLWKFRGKRVEVTPPRIAIIGSLWSCDLILADSMKARELPVVVLRADGERGGLDDGGPLFPHLSNQDVLYFSSPRELLRQLRSFDVVYSFTSSIGFELGKLLFAYPLLRRFGWPPYVNISTGSDNMERSVESSFAGLIERFTMRHAFAQNLAPYPEGIRSAARLRLRNATTIPPVRIAAPNEETRGDPSTWRYRTSASELLLFHPSNLDWGESDPGPRASTKGNDRFLRAFAEFVAVPRAHGPVRLIALDRGADRENARELVRNLGVERLVHWVDHLSRDELFRAIAECDLVVDQFDVGGFGLIAWEALHAGRPVLTYVDRDCESLLYDTPSPVLIAHTTEEIVERLTEASDPARLDAVRERCRRWAQARTIDAFLPRYLLYATLATGRAAADFGWTRPFGHPWSS